MVSRQSGRLLDCTSPPEVAEFYRELRGMDYRAGDDWSHGPVLLQLHLDMTVPDVAALARAHERALALGPRVLLDRTDDEEEPL